MWFNQKLFQIFCPALEYNVILFKQTWEEHVLPAHPDMKNNLDVVKKAIENCKSQDDIFRKIRNPDQVSIHYQCSDFLPMNRYLRIAMLLKKKNGYAIVTSAYPVDNFPKKGSERL